MLGAFVVAVMAFFRVAALPSPIAALTTDPFSWAQVGMLDIRVALSIDHLSAVMALIVTGVGFLIHVYSLGYMAHDENPDRYFTYLNLFAGMMLLLVLGSSLPLLFVGWEGVGLCSYLLIGFWYTDEAKAIAGKKAFVVNRVGDFGFLLGMFVLYAAISGHHLTGGTLSFEELRDGAPLVPTGMITAACLLLFVGACGKSAQFPLYIWLPDAMAGPTPVSALIHAATMVTAGVYMIARLAFLYQLAPIASDVVACTGAFTALFAATMAFVQNDVKKVLAYSTVSQLGFMILAVGAGGYSAGIYHLVTHAFFKALLFLAAGSLIHAMEHALPHGSDPNDIRSMGGLRPKMPVTFWTFTAAWAAICGVPLFSGFFSKDEILSSALNGSLPGGLRWATFLAGVIAAGCTAFYMTRVWILVFFGKPRMGAAAEGKVHESPAVMTAPLAVLGILSVFGGVLWAPLFGWEPLKHWLDPLILGVVNSSHQELSMAEGWHVWLPTVLATLAAAAGIALGWLLYVRRPELPNALAARFWRSYRMLRAKYWVDEAAEGLVVQPVYLASRDLLWKGVDVKVFDGAVNGAGSATRATSGVLAALQTGFVQSYAVAIALGVAAITLYLMTRL
jgi:NADH-quinone oxidoreductase subunit L